MTSGIGLRDGVEIGKDRIRVGPVVQQRRHHDRATAVCCQRLQEIDAGMPALGQHEYATTGLTHGSHQRAQLAVIGQPRGHGHAPFTVVCRRGAGRKSDGTGLHGLAHQGLHADDFVIRSGALCGRLAHHPGADGGVTGKGRDVGHGALALELVEIFRDGLEVPADALAQHIE